MVEDELVRSGYHILQTSQDLSIKSEHTNEEAVIVLSLPFGPTI